MDRRAADRHRVIERLLEDLREFALAARHGAEPALAAVRPRLRVDAELGQTAALELGTDRRGRVVVGKLQLDRLEAGRRRRAEALHERALGEQIGKVGGEAGHDLFSCLQ